VYSNKNVEILLREIEYSISREIPSNSIIKIKNPLKIDDSFLLKSEKISGNSNSENMESLVKGLISIRTLLFSMFLMDLILALQEALTFEEEGNKTIHYFLNTESLFKCEGGFYSTGQILAIKDKRLDSNGITSHRSNNII
jgi:hypothetical protein